MSSKRERKAHGLSIIINEDLVFVDLYKNDEKVSSFRFNREFKELMRSGY